ncbi:MAG: helical backbone metal receptor [Rudanella sp.]|nr:helical backbone metal receptor [Rudanella sp.]
MASTQRIISLVPSLTELLFDLGLDTELVGLTKFCIHPADKVTGKTVVGGTKNVHLDRVAALSPTLIIANKEENTRADIEDLQSSFPVLLTDVITLDDALKMIITVGEDVDRQANARLLTNKISESFSDLERHVQTRSSLPARVAYLIWRDPWMVAGSQTFIDSMLTVSGFANAFASQLRYPVVSPADLQTADPDVIMLSSEPYPFSEKHLTELSEICPRAKLMLVDGELFSWYGSRLLHSAAYFKTLSD